MKETDRIEILLEQIAKNIRTIVECQISLLQKLDRHYEESRSERERIKQQMAIYV